MAKQHIASAHTLGNQVPNDRDVVALVFYGPKGGRTVELLSMETAAEFHAQLGLGVVKPAAPSKMPWRAFIQDGYSIRPASWKGKGQPSDHWDIYLKGERGIWADRGSLIEASDGKTWCFTVGTGGRAYDARPTFQEALAAALELIKAKEAKRHG